VQVDWEFEAEVFQWRGPAPYFFVATPDDVDAFLHDHLGELTYGWGVIPALRRAEDIDDGDIVRVRLSVTVNPV
jgi:hypothetical protein